MDQDSFLFLIVPDCLRVLQQHRLLRVHTFGNNLPIRMWTSWSLNLSELQLIVFCLNLDVWSDWSNLWWICKVGQHDTYTGTWRARQTSLEASGQKSLDFIGCCNLPRRLTPLQTKKIYVITTASWSTTCPSKAHLGPFQQDEWLKQPGILSIFDAWHLKHLRPICQNFCAPPGQVQGSVRVDNLQVFFRYAAMPKNHRRFEISKRCQRVTWAYDLWDSWSWSLRELIHHLTLILGSTLTWVWLYQVVFSAQTPACPISTGKASVSNDQKRL